MSLILAITRRIIQVTSGGFGGRGELGRAARDCRILVGVEVESVGERASGKAATGAGRVEVLAVAQRHHLNRATTALKSR